MALKEIIENENQRIGNGVLSHWNDFNVRRLLLTRRHDFSDSGLFDRNLHSFCSFSEITEPLAIYGSRFAPRV